MSLRQLVEGDCGGVNPLMQLGGQFTRDAAHKDEGFVQNQFERSMRPDEQMVNDFLGQVSAPPQSFQMDTLLQEMREIEQSHSPQLQGAPRVIDQVAGQWSRDFSQVSQLSSQSPSPMQMVHVHPKQQDMHQVHEIFDDMPGCSNNMNMQIVPRPNFFQHTPPLAITYPAQVGATSQFFDEAKSIADQDQLSQVTLLIYASNLFS